MDWTLAIDRNREALLRLVAVLFRSIGLVQDASGATLPRYVRSNILRLLGPAESALRRLIFVAAHTIYTKSVTASAGAARAYPVGLARGMGEGVLAFRLLDPQKRFQATPPRRFAKGGPRLSCPGYDDDPVFEVETPALPDDPVDAARIGRRIEALQKALDDLPRQAKRLLRAQARRSLAPPGPRRVGPLRPGWPPGHRTRQIYEVDTVLSDCAVLARRAVERRNTS